MQQDYAITWPLSLSLLRVLVLSRGQSVKENRQSVPSHPTALLMEVKGIVAAHTQRQGGEQARSSDHMQAVNCCMVSHLPDQQTGHFIDKVLEGISEALL